MAIKSCYQDAYASLADAAFILMCSLGRVCDLTVENVGLVEDLEFTLVNVS